MNSNQIASQHASTHARRSWAIFGVHYRVAAKILRPVFEHVAGKSVHENTLHITQMSWIFHPLSTKLRIVCTNYWPVLWIIIVLSSTPHLHTLQLF